MADYQSSYTGAQVDEAIGKIRNLNTTTTAHFGNDTGEGVIPSDGIRAVTVVSGAVGTCAITLQVPNDNLAHVWDILMTTDSTVAITIATSNSTTIKVPSYFAIAASKAVELSIVGVGSTYYLRYGEFA